ncbi:hypothetical protein D1646_01565 [Pseudoflavonifractor sp. 60]|uniref:hypothetical protein n=1 Tax=Pseudoflavonifractor sp. 60 TaxID=2304576 RepID=UPI0013718636|nr:hypothetical protein [Pseudoflavonifractor sp. 60]NBI65513.1 hypothetical protein [Pseudoflavonifractor sp. 60]
MAVRSVPVKGKLVKMMEANFPAFHFASESGRTYGFVREGPGRWYSYLPINRYFEDGKGDLSINWYLIGGGYVPDWYEWAGSYHTPWRVLAWPREQQPDPAEPPSLLASPGPMASIRYQTGPQKQLDQALEVLRDKLERYALPAMERPLCPAEERRLQRWRLLAEHILPQLEEMELRDPETLAEVKDWQKRTARRWRGGIDENVPPVMTGWREEIASMPGFAEEWDISPILREWVFNWFTHAFYLRP